MADAEQKPATVAVLEQLARVEELRYLVSVKTYDLLRKKKRKEEASGLEVEAEGLKREMNEKLNAIASAGYAYIQFNKKLIDRLREQFLALPIAEKGKALEGEGEGKELIDQLNALLRYNYEHKIAISTAVITLPKLLQTEENREKMKRILEGDESFILADIGGEQRDYELFVKSILSLGYCVKIDSGTLCISRNRIFFIDSPIGCPGLSGDAKTPGIEQFELVTERTQGNQTVEVSAAAEYSEEDLNRKIDAIVRSPKMQRWVLNTFKDEKEREDYTKYQTILTKLMRMKRALGGVKQRIASNAAKLWLNNTRLSCTLENVRSVTGGADAEGTKETIRQDSVPHFQNAWAQLSLRNNLENKLVFERIEATGRPVAFSFL